MTDHLAEAALFEIEQPPPVSLADKFGVPPMSVLDRRSGDWQDRKRRWGMLGMQSELGRDAGATKSLTEGDHFMARLLRGEIEGGMKLLADGVSIFDPVVCELVYRWHTLPGDHVLDPFAGGAVRGIVASTLARHYTGVDLRAEQVEANRAQAHLGSEIAPRWIVGDSGDMGTALHDFDEDFDLVFSCPPYADLEVYSDDPRDLSRMGYDQFRATRKVTRVHQHLLIFVKGDAKKAAARLERG